MIMMKGLRVFVNPAVSREPCEQGIFYSRRSDGPYYRWRYEAEPGRWRGSRVLPYEMPLKELCHASWKVVPTDLQASLAEYYIE